MKRTASLAVAALMSSGLVIAQPATANAAPKVKRYANCAALNRDAAHGVARPGARDKVRGRTKPVTNFTLNLKVYKLNTHLDRDKDGVACEKR